MGESHDDVTKFLEKVSLEGFGEEISHHNAGRAVDKVHFAGGDAVLDKEISDVYVSRLLSGGSSPVALHLHGAHVVLVKVAGVNVVSLRFDKVLGPDGLG